MSEAISNTRDELEAYLAERNTPCPFCKYNLRGLREERCPECGQHVSLAIILGAKERRPGYILLRAAKRIVIPAAVASIVTMMGLAIGSIGVVGAGMFIALGGTIYFLSKLAIWLFAHSGRESRREDPMMTGLCRFLASGLWALACILIVFALGL